MEQEEKRMGVDALLGLLTIVLIVVIVVLLWFIRIRFSALQSGFRDSQQLTENALAAQRSVVEAISAVVTHPYGPPYPVNGLVSALAQPDVALRRAAEAQLLKIGSDAIKPLVTAVQKRRLSVAVATPVLMDCAQSEADLLVVADDLVDQTELCKAILQHPALGEQALNRIAEKGSLSILPLLLSTPAAQGTVAQATAQRRLHEEAERRLKDATSNNDEASDADYMNDERQTGNCDCRWR